MSRNINNPLDPVNADNVVIEGVNAREAANYISARTGEIIANVNQQLADAGVSSDEIKSIVLIGGCAHLNGLKQKLEETLKITVRMGQNPPTLNILNSDINRLEYIEVFSLLAAAAERIGEGETCVELNSTNVGPEFAPRTPAPTPEEPEEPKKPGKKKPKPGSGKWAAWKKHLVNLISEEDEDSEDEQ